MVKPDLFDVYPQSDRPFVKGSFSADASTRSLSQHRCNRGIAASTSADAALLNRLLTSRHAAASETPELA